MDTGFFTVLHNHDRPFFGPSFVIRKITDTGCRENSDLTQGSPISSLDPFAFRGLYKSLGLKSSHCYITSISFFFSKPGKDSLRSSFHFSFSLRFVNAEGFLLASITDFLGPLPS